MEGNRRNFLNKQSHPQFKRTGVPSRRREYNSVRDESCEKFHSDVTVYRILCQNTKIGSVIGKGGSIVKTLREETQAKITVSDSVPGLEDRVIIIFSPSDKLAKTRRGTNSERVERTDDAMEPHCAAQDALLKVHDRIIEEDLRAEERERDETVVTARLLVSSNTVGCILGRKGDVIQRLRSETGANIRVLPVDHLSACAMSSDELVQISGKVAIAKKAIYEVSTLLHQNPRKDTTSLHFPNTYASQVWHSPGYSIRNELHTGESAWLEHGADAHRMESMPFKGDYGIHSSAFNNFDGFTPPREREAPSKFTMKILCSADKIGGVIGKGGSIVRHLEEEMGVSIDVVDVPRDSYERVICVSSFEVLQDQRSQTIDAILYLQDKTSEFSDKGTITTRLLVSSSKVGCILGQGGHIINDMRRRTHADIHVFSKEDKPKCALEDEELVQISGNFRVAKDALTEIASRLRTRYLRDAHAREEHAPARLLRGRGSQQNLHGIDFPQLDTVRGGGFPHLDTVRTGSSGRYEHLQGGVRDFEPPSFPVPPRSSSYFSVDEANITAVSTIGGGHVTEFAGSRMGFQDQDITVSDFATPRQQFSMPRITYPGSAAAASPGADIHRRPGAYQRYNSQRDAYLDNTPSPPVPYRSPNFNRRLSPYRNAYMQHDSYQSMRGHDSYQY